MVAQKEFNLNQRSLTGFEELENLLKLVSASSAFLARLPQFILFHLVGLTEG